jgi:hypothetical protein
VNRVIDTLFQGCAASSYCNKHYPHLQAVFARLVSDLNQHPASVQVTNPQTGQQVRAIITGDGLIGGLRNAPGRISCATSMFLSFLENPNQAPDSTCMSGVGEPLFE